MSGKAHLFVAVVTLASLIFIMRLVRTRRLRAKYSMLWVSVGLGLSIVAASPRLLERLSRLIGVAYPPTTLFIFAVTFLLLIVVHFSWELSRLEERTRILAEEVALLRCGDEQEIHLAHVEAADPGLMTSQETQERA
jgi:hypothetical protein